LRLVSVGKTCFTNLGIPTGAYRASEERGLGGGSPLCHLISALDPIGRPTAPQCYCFQKRPTAGHVIDFSTEWRTPTGASGQLTWRTDLTKFLTLWHVGHVIKDFSQITSPLLRHTWTLRSLGFSYTTFGKKFSRARSRDRRG